MFNLVLGRGLFHHGANQMESKIMYIKHMMLGLGATMILASCAPAVVVNDVATQRKDAKVLPKEFSLLDLGWAISDGAVDIYDPWLDVFMLDPDDRSFIKNIDYFPSHPSMIVRDTDDVHVYSLDSDMVSDASEFVSASTDIAPPVPLVDKEPLTP